MLDDRERVGDGNSGGDTAVLAEGTQLRLGVEQTTEARGLGHADDPGAVAERAEVVEAVVADPVEHPEEAGGRDGLERGLGGFGHGHHGVDRAAHEERRLVREVGRCGARIGAQQDARGERHVAVDALVGCGAEHGATSGRVADRNDVFGVDVAAEDAARFVALGGDQVEGLEQVVDTVGAVAAGGASEHVVQVA